jgi:hypothetical protein
MDNDVVRFVGERLSRPVQSKLLYLFLTYQVVVSALVFIFDSGFPAWIVYAGWILFMLLLAVQALRGRKREIKEDREDREQERLRLQRISRLKKRLETNPGWQTRCGDCEHGGAGGEACRVQASAGEREFRFRQGDGQSFCLLWSPARKA